jgi:hypothetical protein
MFDGNDILPEKQLKKAVAPFEKTGIQEKTLRHSDTDTEEPFPIEVFEGNQIGRLAVECNSVYKVPESLSSLTALGVLSAACGTHYRIEGAASGHSSLGNLYIVLVAESGTGKSSVFQGLAKPIVDASAELQEKANSESMNRETKAELLRDERKKIQRKISKELNRTLYKDTPDYGELVDSMIQINLELKDIENFQPPVYYVQNTTPEALACSLEANDGFMAILSDEAAEVIKVAMGKYSKSGGDISILTGSWSSGPLHCDRVGRERISLKSATLSCALMIQPDVMEEFLSHRETLEQGLLARFIVVNTYVEPQMRTGELLKFSQALSSDWDRFIRRVLAAREGEAETIVTCSSEARKAFDDFYNETVELRKDETSVMKAIYARWAENAIRVSLLLYILEGAQGELSEGIAKRAIKLVRWCGQQVDGLLAYARAKSHETKQEKLLRVVEAQRNITTRKLARSCAASKKEIEQLAQSIPEIMIWESRSKGGNMEKWVGLDPPDDGLNVRYEGE